MKNKLFSYVIPNDDGAAPNPYWRYCTLVICKPKIRSVAKPGDWVVATGSKNCKRLGDIRKYVIYAMKVTEVLSMEDYEAWCNNHCPEKIPDITNKSDRRKCGDCIYDFSINSSIPRVRASVHTIRNRKKDLSGKNALISSQFYYFGDKPVLLPKKLWPIIKIRSGNRSKANNEYFDSFVKWITSNYQQNKLYGNPALNINEIIKKKSCSKRKKEKSNC